MPTTTEGPERPRWVLAAACWAGLLGVYLLLAGGLDWPEVVVGATSSALATLAVMGSGHPDHLGRMRLAWWLLVLWRLPGRVVADSARVLGASLGRSQPKGRMIVVPFDRGGDDPVDGSRRALVVASASIAPNSYVVTVDAGADADAEVDGMLIHQLVPTREAPGKGDRMWPV